MWKLFNPRNMNEVNTIVEKCLMGLFQLHEVAGQYVLWKNLPYWIVYSYFVDRLLVCSGVVRISATRADHKSAALSTPQICLSEFQMKEDDVSSLLKIQGIIKHSLI